MRTSLYALLVLLGAGAQVRAATPREVIEAAIKAHGGAAALKRAALCQRSEVGKLSQPSGELSFKSEVSRRLPDRVRLDIRPQRGPEIVTVLAGDKGWIKAAGPAVAMGPEQAKEMHEETYVAWLATLTPLLDKSFTLSPAAGTKVEGANTVGVKVSRKGARETTLYFSTSNHLLVKIARRAPQAGVLVSKEYLYQNHKEFGGARLPTREVLLINGRVTTQLDIKSWRFPSGGPAATLFERP